MLWARLICKKAKTVHQKDNGVINSLLTEQCRSAATYQGPDLQTVHAFANDIGTRG